MITRKNRFHGHNSVSRVKGSRIQMPLFKVFYAPNHKRRDYRMAVVVSKKTAKSAVTRNRIRRRLYEAVRQLGLLNNKPVDVVFVVSKDLLATAESEELMKQVAKTCQQMVKSD